MRKEFQAEGRSEAKQASAVLSGYQYMGSWFCLASKRKRGNAVQNKFGNIDSLTFSPNPALRFAPHPPQLEAARVLFVLS